MILNQLNDGEYNLTFGMWLTLTRQMTEYNNLRVFNVHPGMAMSKVLRPELHIYAKDSGMIEPPLSDHNLVAPS
jgi:hypothetical protein